ncbi:MAG: SsrA-binding protein SmpB [Candidatus Eisenbacteria bacterium]|nr:SsrA-binding protein SmpB [Candidatus Eisenbacteria bacterium]
MSKKTAKARSGGKGAPEGEDVKLVASNRKARHEYHILEVHEAGIALLGPEVKSLRAGRVSLAEAYAQIQDEEIFIVQMHITPYADATHLDLDPKRRRKLLLHKREIRRLRGKTEERGLTLVPLRIYFRRGRVKLEIALARGKRQYDKRQALARKDAQRDMERVRSRRYE